jgi:mucin-19
VLNNYNTPVITNANFVVSPKPITISGITATGKVYDGTNSVTLNKPTVSTLGFITRDNIAITTTGAFDVVDVGTQSVTLTQSYSGTTANYTITNQTAKPTAAISAKPITISGITATDKVYDGATSISLSKPSVTTLGFIARDSIAIDTTGTVASADVGSLKTVTLSHLYSGTTSNYTITDQSASPTVNITAKPITISGITATAKAYDGTSSVTLSKPTVSSLGFVARDNIAITTTGIFDVVDVGTQTVTLTQSYSGTTSNYTITNQSTKPSAAISAKAITISGITASGKTYDGTNSVALNKPTVSSLGFVARDNIIINATGVFDVVDVGTQTVTLTQSYGGTTSNYTITNQSTKPSAAISAKAITVSGITANGKTYDGTSSVTLNKPTVSSLGFIARDSIVINTTGVFDVVDVGTQSVTLTQSYGGTTSNYTITNQATKPTAAISAKAITVSGITANGKTYDGTNSVTLSKPVVTTLGFIARDNIVINTTGTFDVVDVGTQSVTLTQSYSGTTSNYTITDQATKPTAAITAKAITISGITAVNKVYDGTTFVSLTVPTVSSLGFIERDNIAITSTGAALSADVGNTKTVTLTQSYGLEQLLTIQLLINHHHQL